MSETIINEKERQEMAEGLFRKEKKTFMIAHIAIWFVAIICLCLMWADVNMGNFHDTKILFFCCIFLVAFFASLQFSLVKGYTKINKSRKAKTYTYHYLDVIEYTPDRYSFNVKYILNGKTYSAITDVYGAKKIHVFDCDGEHLTVVEEPPNS